jgi:hypothetical protein
MPHGEATRGVARLLLEEGVNIEAGDKSGLTTPLLEAVKDIRRWLGCYWRRGLMLRLRIRGDGQR